MNFIKIDDLIINLDQIIKADHDEYETDNGCTIHRLDVHSSDGNVQEFSGDFAERIWDKLTNLSYIKG